MELKEIAKKLESTNIQKLEYIASQISAHSQAEYSHKFSDELVRQKLENSQFPYEHFSSEYPYLLENEGGILIGVSPGLMITDSRKRSLKRFAQELKRDTKDYSGLIQFLPFQMNGKQVRTNLEKELDIAFVNLPYDQKGLERRFYQYGQS
ncbi:MAG: hypothetical protein ACQESG_05965 [Nanobdellota archaeon]